MQGAAGVEAYAGRGWLGSPDWSLAARLPGAACGLVPRAAGRFIWQSAPRVVWAAGEVEPGEGWSVDAFRRDGRVTAAPGPPTGVPSDLLRRLGGLWDPEGRLGSDRRDA